MCTAVFVFTQAELPLELNCWLTGETGWHPEPRTGKACLGNQHKTQACLFGKEPTSKHRHRHRPRSAAQTAREQDWVIEDQNPPRWLCLSLICFQEWQAHEARREIQTRANLLSVKQTRLGNIYINWMHGSLWDLMGCTPECWGSWLIWLWDHSYLWKVMAIQGGSSGLEESKCHFYPQKWQRGGHQELQVSQAHRDPWEDRAKPLGDHFQTYKG